MNTIKAVIPVAGFGTRMLPATKAVPKELLPIIDRPVIQYVIEEAMTAGLSDVLLVTARDKRAIEDHFDRNADLEAALTASGKIGLVQSISALMAKVKIHAVRQPRQRGLGDAVLQARQFVGAEPFVCLLGDAIFSGNPLPALQLIQAARVLNTAVIGLEEVPAEKVDRYGIVAGKMIDRDVIRIDALVEKPSPTTTPSRLAVAARYVLTPEIFDCLEKTPQGKGGEIQLTDALRLLLERQPIHGVVLRSQRFDVGNPLDWLRTNLFFAARDPQLWSQLQPTLKDLISRG